MRKIKQIEPWQDKRQYISNEFPIYRECLLILYDTKNDFDKIILQVTEIFNKEEKEEKYHDHYFVVSFFTVTLHALDIDLIEEYLNCSFSHMEFYTGYNEMYKPYNDKDLINMFFDIKKRNESPIRIH